MPTLSEKQANFIYASEADLLNVALFGKTASEWRKENPTLKGNIRDYATMEQLICLSNMENINAYLIEQKKYQSERIVELNRIAIKQMQVLMNNNDKLLIDKKN